MLENHPIFQMDDFQRKLEWLRRKVDKTLADRIQDAIIQKIAIDPVRATKRIKAESLKPQRVLRVGDWRLFFLYCAECRREGYVARWNCPNCSEIPDAGLVLCDIEKRGDAYE